MIWAINAAASSKIEYHSTGFGKLKVMLDLPAPPVPSLPAPFTTVKVRDDLSFDFNFEDDNTTIVFLIRSKTEGYASIGFGTTMKDGDIMIA